jgi:nicotinamidase-related amidase
MINRHPAILSVSTSALVVVDIQDALLGTVHQPEPFVLNCRLLIRAAQLLGVPVISTVQNPSKLGAISQRLIDLIPSESAISKMSFSCCAEDAFVSALQGVDRPQVLLCGLETHICVAQTALDLVSRGFQAHVAVDSVTSRSFERHKLGMEKMRDCGIVPCSAEQAVFELTETSVVTQFRQMSRLVKETDAAIRAGSGDGA